MPQPSSDLDVGRRIMASRLQRGLSQGAVARRAGFDPSYLSRIETGRVHPTVRTAIRLASALGISLSDLLGPSPAERSDRPCPVSRSGHCLMDLIDTGTRARRGARPESFSPRQIRLLRRFTMLLERGQPDLLKAMEVLIGQILDGGDRRRRR
ncbi:MAG: helix-turn-helix domain-containing protein [Acidobacteriota bacterium]